MPRVVSSLAARGFLAATATVLFTVLGPAAALAASPAEVEPRPGLLDPQPAVRAVLERFNRSLVFHAGFESDVADADLAAGDHQVQQAEGSVTWAPGLAGRALASGVVHYAGGANFPLGSPGTVLLWLSISRTDPTAAGEGYLFPLRVLGGDSNVAHALLMLGKIDRPNGCHLYAHVEASGGRHGQIHSASTLGWQAGQWHLLALTWRPGSFEFAVDAATPQMAVAPRLPAASRQVLLSAVTDAASGLTCLVDELFVVNRPLDPAEVAWVYQQLCQPGPGLP